MTTPARGEISLGDVTAVVLGQATQGFRNAPRSLALACFSLTLGAEGSSVDFMAVNERDLAVWTTVINHTTSTQPRPRHHRGV